MSPFSESVNPYVSKSKKYPGRIFAGEQLDKEKNPDLEKILNSQKIYCEFGSGSGKHLISLAKDNPDASCIGYEIRYKRAVRTLEKCSNTKNVYVFRADYNHAEDLFRPNSIDGLHVNFPDPWAKKKWHKHRILNKDFILSAQRLLKNSGYLKVKTDHKEYFESFLEEFKHSTSNLKITFYTKDLMKEESIQSYPTEFESLFTSKGLPIYYLEARMR